MSRKRELRVTDYLQHIFDAIERIDTYNDLPKLRQYVKSMLAS